LYCKKSFVYALLELNGNLSNTITYINPLRFVFNAVFTAFFNTSSAAPHYTGRFMYARCGIRWPIHAASTDSSRTTEISTYNPFRRYRL